MTKYAKEPCAKCGEIISTFPPLKAKHDLVCQGITVEQRKIDPAKIKNQQARELYAKAIAKQAQLIAAPEIFAAEAGLDEHMELVKTYAPECLGPNAKYHAYIGDPREMDRDAQKGYLPVFDDDGNMVTDRGQPLYTIPIELHRARVKAAQDESRSRLSELDVAAKEMQEMSGLGARVKEVEKTITEERLNDG